MRQWGRLRQRSLVAAVAAAGVLVAGLATAAGSEVARPAAGSKVARPAAGAAARPGASEAISSPMLLGSSGWTGYAWYTGSWQVSTSVRLPYVYPARNAGAAFWAGFGDGPGIEQTGFTANMVAGHLQWTEWYELYPAPPARFGWRAYSGNLVSMTVTCHGWGWGWGWYELTIHDITRGWWSSVWRRTSTPSMGVAEAVVEAYGPPLARFTPARFCNISAGYPWPYVMPGTYLSPLRWGCFTVYG
jgi:hypothetical protein